MGIFDWFKPKPTRSVNAVARDLAEAVFALHPAAKSKVMLQVNHKRQVVMMEVPELDPTRDPSSSVDPAEQTALIAQQTRELSQRGFSMDGNELTVMRDRVIWMPSVITFQPPIP